MFELSFKKWPQGEILLEHTDCCKMTQMKMHSNRAQNLLKQTSCKTDVYICKACDVGMYYFKM